MMSHESSSCDIRYQGPSLFSCALKRSGSLGTRLINTCNCTNVFQYHLLTSSTSQKAKALILSRANQWRICPFTVCTERTYCSNFWLLITCLQAAVVSKWSQTNCFQWKPSCQIQCRRKTRRELKFGGLATTSVNKTYRQISTDLDLAMLQI